jgi:hypothetical protein
MIRTWLQWNSKIMRTIQTKRREMTLRLIRSENDWENHIRGWIWIRKPFNFTFSEFSMSRLPWNGLWQDEAQMKWKGPGLSEFSQNDYRWHQKCELHTFSPLTIFIIEEMKFRIWSSLMMKMKKIIFYRNNGPDLGWSVAFD